MDDLEVNPLHKALLTKFRREFDIACKMSYLIAIPHSGRLEHCTIDQYFVNSHILMPSKLLKMHFNQLQVGNFDDIEIDDRKLICQPGEKKAMREKVVVNILAEEVGYNVFSKEYRTVLIDRPLVMTNSPAGQNQTRTVVSMRTILAPLSPGSMARGQIAKRQRAQLISSRSIAHHDDCAKYLECISQELTVALEEEVKRLQTNYIVLSQYLEDASCRIRSLVECYIEKYQRKLEQSHASLEWLCETIQRSIRMSVENYVVHLLHGKLMPAIHKSYEKEDAILQTKMGLILKSKLTLAQLGARLEFSDFTLDDELIRILKRFPNLQSPIAMVSCLMKLVDLISEGLNQSVRLKRLLGHNQSRPDGKMLHSSVWEPTPICSDDLIATFVFCLPRARPNNLFSAIRYLEIFGWSSVAKNQPSYYLATFESAVEYILNFSHEQHEQHLDPQERVEARILDASILRKGHEDEEATSDYGSSDLTGNGQISTRNSASVRGLVNDDCCLGPPDMSSLHRR